MHIITFLKMCRVGLLCHLRAEIMRQHILYQQVPEADPMCHKWVWTKNDSPQSQFSLVHWALTAAAASRPYTHYIKSYSYFICRGSQSTPGSSSLAACLTSSLSTEKLRRCSVWATATRIHSISGGSTRNGLQAWGGGKMFSVRSGERHARVFLR